MAWYIIGGILLIIALGLMIFNYIRERHYLKKKASESMSVEMWEEIEAEREASLERQKKFHEALEEAQKSETHDS